MHKEKSHFKIIAVIVVLALFLLIVIALFLSLNMVKEKIELKKIGDRINILLLGIGGETHDGPNLTDTIIFASIDTKANKTVLVSIPRDLWVEDLKGRVNIAYAKGGLMLSKSVVSKILGQPIDYVMRIDFAGFEKAIDLLGGVDVNVINILDDFQYPISGKEDDPCGHPQEDLKTLATASSQLDVFPCRYLHLHFDKGLQRMNGEKALQFVRSRHAIGNEGTDFARSKRQEELIKGVKDKIFSIKTFLNPIKVFSIFNAIKSSVDTNIGEEEFDDFIKLAIKMKGGAINNAILDYGDEMKNREGLLIHPDISAIYNNEWVLIPRTGNNNFEEIQKYVKCEISYFSCGITATGITTPTPTIIPQ